MNIFNFFLHRQSLDLHPGWLVSIDVSGIIMKVATIYNTLTGPECYLEWLFLRSKCGYPSHLPLDDIKFTADLARKLDPEHVETPARLSSLTFEAEISHNAELFESYRTDSIEGGKVMAVLDMKSGSAWKALVVLKHRYEATRKTEDFHCSSGRNDSAAVLQLNELQLAVQDARLQALIMVYTIAAKNNITRPILPNTLAATV
ncbi:hypothetical protein BDP27DRAFT_1312117 [Rhodocollybia butyracea]|uniref:Uncharacterized protein n=1 Tax=Rhodocollybia butyracea TaxID=206335 RepID=A0A9P5Q2P8_9AGAR|nr:hypothetical protein BDP27DRAFT_1312117 [Rhodocollybia butyracea]